MGLEKSGGSSVRILIAVLVIALALGLIFRGGITGLFSEGTVISDDGLFVKYDLDSDGNIDTVLVYRDLDASGSYTEGDIVEVQSDNLADLAVLENE